MKKIIKILKFSLIKFYIILIINIDNLKYYCKNKYSKYNL